MRAFLRAVPAAALLAAWMASGAPAAAQVQVTLRPLAPVEAIFIADLLPGDAALRAAAVTVLGTDLRQRGELDGVAQSVPGGTAGWVPAC